ncbi:MULTISPECIES: DUF1214 domain-containing protein [unclassified Mycobacterium]|uniref:DUF1214 domain-containing protein n=1 Tax=unclassified Mycobacterium TaxID=2642494 RepID=UPI0029C6BFD5|nr:MULTISPECIES: DUF1214 domain-containing protein [unclassified Mycobacterium]
MTETPELDAAWESYSDRVKAAGQSIAGFTDDPRLRAEGYRYVGRLSNLAHQIYLEFGDPLVPMLFRYGDDVTPFGATNTDNNYCRTMVDPAGTYRITGDISGVKELLVSIHDGEMVLGKVAVLAEVSLGDLKVDEDGRLELIVGGPEVPGNWIPLTDEAVYVNVRQFVADWERDPIAVLTIERLDSEHAASNVTPSSIASALDRAATWVEASVAFWNMFSDGIKAMTPINEFSAPHRPAGGAVNMVHGACQWNLASDQALVVEFDEPTATYWSIQTYMLHWLQPLDFANRVTSLNDGQVRVDDDGKVRVVISSADPGVQNWLDTSGLDEGLCSYRWVRASTEPTPTATLVNIADVRAHLPEPTPAFGPQDRNAQLASRRRGVARRFRR